MATSQDALSLCETAWGKQKGYVFLAVRNPETKAWKDLPFKWPEQREEVQRTLVKAKESSNDVYWAPAVYSSSRRHREKAKPSRVLWADLDDVDPEGLEKGLKPAAAWETSPGRYQAIWVLPYPLSREDHNRINQRLTYAIGADKGGWDTTQVLRTPGTHNHKYAEGPTVRVLWANGRVVDPVTLAKLPDLTAALDKRIPDARKLLHQKRKRLPARALEFLKATHTSPVGTRSERLWELECLLAEAGLKTAEIVSLVQASVWNKFRNRHDEVDRLFTEAKKALDWVGKEKTQTPEVDENGGEESVEESDDLEMDDPTDWATFDRDRVPIDWMIADVWGEGEVGFISGLPKSYKSWVSLDLAVSVATGTRFLDTFESKRHNVLLIQVEDPKSVIQDRLAKIAEAKDMLWVKRIGKKMHMFYNLPKNLWISTASTFDLTDESAMEKLEQWIKERDIQLVILDPLMMMAGHGDVDEFKAIQFMGKVLKPLKVLRSKTKCAIIVVHHHTKADKAGPGGQAMYGSVALWAWEEAGIHISVEGVRRVILDRFSKHALLPPLHMEISDTDKGWMPVVTKGSSMAGVLDQLTTMIGGATIDELETATGLSRDAIQRHLKKLIAAGKVGKERGESSGAGRKKIRYVAKPETAEDGTG